MRLTSRILAVAFVLGAMGGRPDSAPAQFEDLLKKVPPLTNALVVIDVDGLKKAPLAIKEKWAESHEKTYISRPIILPPEANKIVLASHLSPQQEMVADWELAVMSLNEPLSMKAIARAEGGYVDTINGLESVWTPSNAYFVNLGDKSMGMMYPANRQHVARWAEFGLKNSEIVASKYLRDAAYSVGPAGQIVMALDIQDMPQPHRTREGLANSKTLADKKVDLDSLVQVITSIQGVILTVDVEDKARGKVRVDFGENVSLLKPFAKPLLLEAMNKWGAVIEDFDNWKVQVGDTYITLEGDLSTSGMRRIFSMLEVPTTKFSTLADQTSASQSSSSPAQSEIAQSSMAYFKSVNTLVDDLREEMRKRFPEQQTLWLDRYARKIDRLPILNVDEQLLAFGAAVAESFRNMALARKSAAVSSGVRKSGVYTDYYYSGGGGDYAYGYGSTRTAASVKNEINRQEFARATEVRITGWKDIEDQLAAIRKDLTKKYNVEF